MIKDAVFVSVWDGCIEIETPCRVNTETKEVFDIVQARYNGNILEKEYIEIDDEAYPVYRSDSFEISDEDFWYE